MDDLCFVILIAWAAYSCGQHDCEEKQRERAETASYYQAESCP